MTVNPKNTLFKNRPFVFLLSAQIISNIGDWLHILALFGLVALKWHASPFAMTGVVLCMAIPGILLGTLAGVIADKFDRKKLMILADVCRCFIVIGIAFSNHLWQVYVLLCLLSAFSDLFSPAKSGKLKEIIDDDHMQQAVSYSQIISNSAKIIGPTISGLFVATVGIHWAFYLDSVSFILSALLLLGVPKTATAILDKANQGIEQDGDTSDSGFLKELVRGLSFMKTSPVLLTGLTILCFVFLALQISDSQAMILLRLVPGSPIDIAGYAMAASGAGMLVSSVILSKKTLGSSLLTLVLSPIALGLSLLAAGVFIHLPVSIITILFPIIFFIAGFSFSMAIIPFDVLTQKKTPAQYTGRVFGTINSVSTFAVIIGLVTGGFLSEFLGVIFAFIFSGCLLVVIGLIVASFRKTIESRDQLGTESLESSHRTAKV